MYIMEGTKFIVDGIDTQLSLTCDMEVEKFIRSVRSIYPNLTYIETKNNHNYFVTKKPNGSYIYRIKFGFNSEKIIEVKVRLKEGDIIYIDCIYYVVKALLSEFTVFVERASIIHGRSI
jgi:hypothetical protein